MRTLALTLILVINLVITSCSEEEGNLNCLETSGYADILEAFDIALAAGQTWGSDPTSANCEAWKAATNAYLDAIEQFDVDGCEGISQQEYNDMLEEARTSVQAVNCS